jgi:Fe-S-cluster containining protein
MTIELERIQCGCDKCQGCCENIPGWFKPGEVDKAAALIGMPVREFFERFLTVDYWERDGRHDHEVFVLRPSTRDERPGTLASRHFWRGRCVFLTPERRCGIHAAKPHECAVVTGCDRAGEQNINHRPFISDMWDTDEARAEIARVTGTPVVEDERIVVTDTIAIDVPLTQSASERAEQARRALSSLAGIVAMMMLLDDDENT